MIEVKQIEARDRGTFIPMLAVRLVPNVRDDSYVIRRAGYGVGNFYVLLTNLANNETESDPFMWKEAVTAPTVHQELIEHWDNYPDGAVVDAEFIRCETPAPKVSERTVDGTIKFEG